MWTSVSLFVATNSVSSRARFIAFSLYVLVLLVLIVRIYLRFNSGGDVDCGYGTTSDIVMIVWFSIPIVICSTFFTFLRLISGKAI